MIFTKNRVNRLVTYSYYAENTNVLNQDDINIFLLLDFHVKNLCLLTLPSAGPKQLSRRHKCSRRMCESPMPNLSKREREASCASDSPSATQSTIPQPLTSRFTNA